MRNDDRLFLKGFFQQVIDTPLSPGDPRYVPLYKYRLLIGFDPVEVMARTIEWTSRESVQLFSGFRGTGKSTELRRLQHILENKGRYIVLLCDIQDYLNTSSEVDVSDFLMALAGAFNNALEERGFGDHLSRSCDELISSILTRIRVEIPEINVGIPSGGISAKFKASMKYDQNFKRRVQEKMAGSLAGLVEDVHEFLEECVDAVQKHTIDNDVELVLLMDSVEHIRGSSVNALDVQSSVETLFASHADKLHLPRLHVVYTVPPYLRVRYAGLGSLYEPGGVQILPAFKLFDKRGRSIEKNYDAIEKVISARGDWRRLLGERALLDLLIRYSGGHLRDLLRLVAEVLIRTERVPASESTVRAAIDQLRTEYLPIADSDAKWLAKIAESKQTELPSVSELPTLARFLDTHLALCYRNGDEWYDVHPLISDQVKIQASGSRSMG